MLRVTGGLYKDLFYPIFYPIDDLHLVDFYDKQSVRSISDNLDPMGTV